MHVCNLAHVWTLQRLAIWSTFWLSTTFLFFSEPMQVVIAPAVQFPMDLCSASAIQPISFLSCCKSKLFNSKEIANLKSQIPSLAFHSEQHANAQTILPLYFLSGSSAKPKCCRSRRTPCQPSGSTRCPLNVTQVRKGNLSGVDQHHKHLVLNYISTQGNAIDKVGKPHWQSLL